MSLSSPLPPLLHPVEVADFDALLQGIGQQLGATAHLYDESGAFPRDNFALLHQHGLLALTVPKHLGGGGASLALARKVISAVAKGEPSTALILVMQYLQHSRLQDSKSWPEALRLRVAADAVHDGALINALRVEPDLGTPARGGPRRPAGDHRPAYRRRLAHQRAQDLLHRQPWPELVQRLGPQHRRRPAGRRLAGAQGQPRHQHQ
ncbi:acyl-CoA dehydrogenase [Pseudomonas chlororaphis]|uniref:Acyl-CoA dehydrogenase n=1 Tax=Pseudomonas chlororaphis TaxID=587753 RepID=A0AAX3FN28_9PSED|nr:acyl-CoA dehydrogenase [Pseudomonas chlororaphis]